MHSLAPPARVAADAQGAFPCGPCAVVLKPGRLPNLAGARGRPDPAVGARRGSHAAHPARIPGRAGGEIPWIHVLHADRHDPDDPPGPCRRSALLAPRFGIPSARHPSPPSLTCPPSLTYPPPPPCPTPFHPTPTHPVPSYSHPIPPLALPLTPSHPSPHPTPHPIPLSGVESCALSFSAVINSDGSFAKDEITISPSIIQAERLTYEQVI